MRIALILFLLVCFVGPAFPQVVVTDTEVTAFDALEARVRYRIEPIPEVPAGEVTTEVINGTPVDPAFFPAIFRMTTGGTCTATAIGPATILIAAHCVDHLAFIDFVTPEVSILGICEQAPGYEVVDDSEDWALCLLERELGGIPFETVDLETIPAVSETLILTGYGCTQEGGPLDGRLRIGLSTVAEKPFGWPDETSTIYTASDMSVGGAILCPGDSGGPLFRFLGGVDEARAVVGVNSRTTFEFGVSLFSSMASAAGSSFVTDWAGRHGQMICGLNLENGCR